MRKPNLILREQLSAIRNVTIDDTILATTLLMVANYILSIFRDAALIAQMTTAVSLIAHMLIRGGLALIICSTLYIFRHRIHYRWKYFFLVATGTEVFIYSVYLFGNLAPGKALMIFATLLVAFGFHFRLAIVMLVALTLSYLFSEWMFVTGQWQFSSPSGIKNFILNPVTWLGQGFLVTGITITLMRMGAMQKKAIMDSMQELEEVNSKLKEEEAELTELGNNLEALVDEKTRELRSTNEEQLRTNQTLTDRNTAHLLQQEELDKVMREYEEKQASLMESGKLAAIGMLTAGMAHEINNPLNFIMGATHLLETETIGSPQREAYTASVARIRENVTKTSQLIAGLNQFNRRTDRMDEQCDLSAIARNVLFIINPEGLGKGIIFSTRFPDATVRITGNSGKLHQAILHLFEQALRDAAPDSTIEISLKQADNEIRLRITCALGNETEMSAAPTTGSRRLEALGVYIMNRILKEHRAVLVVGHSRAGKKKWEAVFRAD